MSEWQGWKERDGRERTPCGRVGVVDGGVDVAEIDLAHEAVDLEECGDEHRAGGMEAGKLTLSCREKLANLD